MPEGLWAQSHFREAHVSEAGIVGYRGPNSKGQKWFNHMSAAVIRERLGEKIWSEYFKFTIIRNPFDKVISQFYFAISGQGGADPISIPEGGEIPAFQQWISSGVKRLDRNKYFIDGEICVDKFIRYENLIADLKGVCEVLQIDFDRNALPTFKSGIRSKRIPVRDYYDPESISIVQNLYGWELDNFGYSLPDE